MPEYAWYSLPNGRSVYRRVPEQRASERSTFPCPLILRDEIAPTRSMADGREYTSLSALRRTYRADGNPQREDYLEIGDAPMTGGPKSKEITDAEMVDIYDRAEAAVSSGNVPQIGSTADPL